ncbi:MAG: hypothetical protein HC896_08000 [Bacteroidales bacterium]|nr:hypothetical protein [Bacteroidales bacterium]
MLGYCHPKRKNILIAEIDYKLLRYLCSKGFNLEIIAEPKDYLGSLTVPVAGFAHELKKILPVTDFTKYA